MLVLAREPAQAGAAGEPAGIPEIRNASDKPSDNDPRQRQPERDVSRQCYASELR